MAAFTISNFDQASQRTYYPFKAWLVCIAASLFFFYEFIQMMMFNSIDTELMTKFHVGPAALGNLSAMYFYANALCLLPAAIILDRFSTKKAILFATLLCSASIFGFTLSDSLHFSELCRFTEGMGAAFVMLSCMRLASRWFPSNRLAFVTGIIITIAMMGGVVAQTPLILLKEYFNQAPLFGLEGWQNALLCDSLLGIIIAGIIFIFVQDYPPNYHQEKEKQKNQLKQLGLYASFKKTWGYPYNWLCAFYAASLNFPIYLLGAIWGVLFLTGQNHFSEAEASLSTSMLFVGSIVGAPIIGWFSDTIKRRRLPMLLCAIATLIIVLIIMKSQVSYIPMAGLFFILGFFTSAQILSYPLVSEMNPIALNSTSVSIISSLIMLSGAFGQPFFGWLMAQHETKINSVAHYDFHAAMMMIPIALIITIVITLFLPESKCERMERSHLAETLQENPEKTF